MTTRHINVDRITITTLAMIAVLPFLAMSPVEAATIDCQARFETVRIEAENAEPKNAAKALRTARTAEKICIEGNRFEADRKFTQARQYLGAQQQLAYTR